MLLFIFVDCKNETKTESTIHKSVYEMWSNFKTVNPEFKKDELPDSWYFHNNKEDANRLANLTVTE